jgi:hypothetical protein
MEENFAITGGGKQAPAQLSFWDLIEPDSTPITQSTDQIAAAEPVSPAQQPAADRAIALVDEAPAPTVTTTDRIDGAAGVVVDGDGVAAEANKNTTPETKPDSILPRGLIPAKIGREGMSHRAVRIYSLIGALKGLNALDLLAEGDPIIVDIKSVKTLRPFYMAVDPKYKEAIKDSRAGERVNIPREHKRAWDRARQDIWRGLSDLVRIYAADELVEPGTGKTTGYRIYRLPEVRRRQMERGAIGALKRPNGGRILVDSKGSEIGRQPNSQMMRQPESQVQEAVERSSDD